jgi:hypothetical protein
MLPDPEEMSNRLNDYGFGQSDCLLWLKKTLFVAFDCRRLKEKKIP